MIVVLAISAAAALIVANKELRRLRAENRQLRIETGTLAAEDATKVAVLQLRTLEERTWKWKIYLPPGQWALKESVTGIPARGYPSSLSAYSFPATSGQKIIEATLRNNADGKLQLVVAVDNSTMRSELSAGHALAAGRGFYGHIAGNGQEESFDVDEPIVLIRMRAMSISATNDDGSPRDGIMVWLERAK